MKNLTTFLLIALLGMPAAFAAPGAHGPDGEHLDTPGGHVHTNAGPRIESADGSFELLGHLTDEELSILIDRYETNEPVLDGKLEVEAQRHQGHRPGFTPTTGTTRSTTRRS